MPEILGHLTEALKYNLQKGIQNGKQQGHQLIVASYNNLMKNQEHKVENPKDAYIVGWCIELLHAAHIIYDDILDQSISRYGQPCWHQMKNIGLKVFNDAIIFDKSLFLLMRLHLGTKDYYAKLMELFQEVALVTSYGQHMDLTYSRLPPTEFNVDMYKTTTDTKVAYCGFYLPSVAAMYMAGIKNPLAYDFTRQISLDMGHLFQAQNDWMDCFGHPERTGKPSSDIEGGKCTWLATECMQRANPKQKQIMVECYGKKDSEKSQRVKDLYKTLDLPNVYAAFEKKTLEAIRKRIQQASKEVPGEVMLQTLNTIYQQAQYT
ncbi:farnesyl pyrophosphate synthase-like [Stomoxys calcitrans]|uniref:farnesyl pyrophosphate synthase-like n=1 Tax=Stomoxys calcitrans TaxID=35570 RepID=UPI0027E26AE6|nr:farnesyl pyrophosphate synthase-like [Stomoxys calcitrans]